MSLSIRQPSLLLAFCLTYGTVLIILILHIVTYWQFNNFFEPVFTLIVLAMLWLIALFVSVHTAFAKRKRLPLIATLVVPVILILPQSRTPMIWVDFLAKEAALEAAVDWIETSAPDVRSDSSIELDPEFEWLAETGVVMVNGDSNCRAILFPTQNDGWDALYGLVYSPDCFGANEFQDIWRGTTCWSKLELEENWYWVGRSGYCYD